MIEDTHTPEKVRANSIVLSHTRCAIINDPCVNDTRRWDERLIGAKMSHHNIQAEQVKKHTDPFMVEVLKPNVVPLEFIQLASRIPNFIPNTIRTHVFPCSGELKIHLNNKKSCDCSLEVLSLLSREGTMYYIVKVCDARMAISEDWFIVTPVRNFNTLFRSRTGCHRCYHLLKKHMPELKSYISRDSWLPDLLVSGDVEANPGPGHATTIWHYHFTQKVPVVKFSLGNCKYFFVLKIALSGNVEKNPGPMGEFYDDEFCRRAEPRFFPKLYKKWRNGCSSVGTLNFALERDLEGENLYICFKCMSWRAGSHNSDSWIDGCNFCKRPITVYNEGMWEIEGSSAEQLQKMWWMKTSIYQNYFQWLPEELGVDMIAMMGSYSYRTGWKWWPSWEDMVIVRLCESWWPDQGSVKLVPPRVVQVGGDDITMSEFEYLQLHEDGSHVTESEWVPDLTEEGIEPNPGPKGKRQMKNYRDRSGIHHIPFSFQMCNTDHKINYPGCRNLFVGYLKQFYPSMLPHLEDLTLALENALATAYCRNCFEIYEKGPVVKVCKCFVPWSIEEIFDYIVVYHEGFHPEDGNERDGKVLAWAVQRERVLGIVTNIRKHYKLWKQAKGEKHEKQVIYDPFSVPEDAREEVDISSDYRDYLSSSNVPDKVSDSPVGCISPNFTGTSSVDESLEDVFDDFDLTSDISETAHSPVRVSEKLSKLETDLRMRCPRERRSLAEEMLRKFKHCKLSVKTETHRRLSTGVKHLEKLRDGKFEKFVARMMKKLPSLYEQEALMQLSEEQQDLWQTYWNTFPQEFRFLLDIRSEIYFSKQGIGAFDLPPYMTKFSTAWQNCPRFVPQGGSLCVIGWDGFMREVETDVNVIRQGMLEREEPGRHVPRKRLVRYVVGPAPYANHIGFFYNEMWIHEHYDELRRIGFVPREMFGEFCLYENVGDSEESENWTIPSRYTFEYVDKDLAMSAWWWFSSLDKSVVIVDSLIPNVFTDGATVHDGTYVNACRRIIATGFSYGSYWNNVVHGTATYFGQKVVHENTNLMMARMTDSEFRVAISGWLTNMRVFGRLWDCFMRSTTLQGTVNHPLNPLPQEEKDGHSEAIPAITGEVAREIVKEKVEVAVEEVKDSALVQNSIHGVESTVRDVKMVAREGDSRLAHVPILCAFSFAYNDAEHAAKQKLMEARRNLINLGTPENEWEKTSIAVWPVEHWGTMAESCLPERANGPQGMSFPCPVVGQMCTWAIQNNEKVSIYDLPTFDPTRIRLRMNRDLNELDYSKARPELLYWIHFNDLYVPSPHASLWTVLMRCGKALPEFDGRYDEEFNSYCESNFVSWKVRYDPISHGLDSVALNDFLATIDKMAASSKRRRLEWFLSYMMGNASVNNETMRFFTKTDESLISDDPDTAAIHGTGLSGGFTPLGKPRSIFNASNVTFATTQPDLRSLKAEVKVKGEDDIEMGGYVVPMPKVFRRVFNTKRGPYVMYLRYMADTDNVQDAAWISEAWKGADHEIYIAVGGDDNNTVMYWRGKRYELEGDLSMCDQSMRGLFSAIFIEFLRCSGMSDELVEMIRRTYTDNASYFIGNELVAVIEFLEGQLKTGVSHTSFSNTFIVGLLIMFGIEKMVKRFDDHDDEVTLKGMNDFLIGLWLDMGITMKLKLFTDNELPCSTFHKRYFVPSERDRTMFCAVSLPSTIVKLAAVRAPQKMSKKTFFKRLKESANSRKGMAQHPWVRKLCNKLGCTLERGFVKSVHGFMDKLFTFVQTDKFDDVEERGAYSGHINKESWAEAEGDGLEEDHIQFCLMRYGIQREQHEMVMREIDLLDVQMCHRVGETEWGQLIWGLFKIDYG